MILSPTDMYLEQMIQVKITSLWSLRKTPPLKKMTFMNIYIISQEYRDSSLPHKDDGLGHTIHTIGS